MRVQKNHPRPHIEPVIAKQKWRRTKQERPTRRHCSLYLSFPSFGANQVKHPVKTMHVRIYWRILTWNCHHATTNHGSKWKVEGGRKVVAEKCKGSVSFFMWFSWTVLLTCVGVLDQSENGESWFWDEEMAARNGRLDRRMCIWAFVSPLWLQYADNNKRLKII